jgi:hypothetical protein
MQRGLSHPMAHITIWLQLCLLQPNMAYCNTFCVLHLGENLVVRERNSVIRAAQRC